MSFEDFETIDLAADLMVPTEEKVVPAVKVIPEKENASAEASSEVKTDDSKVALNDLISPDESADHLVTGIDSILGLIGSAFYAVKTSNILNKEEKELAKIARKKKPSDRSEQEQFLIDYLDAEKQKLSDKADGVDLTEKEIAKLKKSSKAYVKMKNIKVGPEIAFYVTLTDIITDRIIDAFVD